MWRRLARITGKHLRGIDLINFSETLTGIFTTLFLKFRKVHLYSVSSALPTGVRWDSKLEIEMATSRRH